MEGASSLQRFLRRDKAMWLLKDLLWVSSMLVSCVMDRKPYGNHNEVYPFSAGMFWGGVGIQN